MSARPITANDVIKYLGAILNIDTNNTLVMDDIIEDLISIHDLGAFRIFIKENFTNEEYKYLPGYPKFVELVKNFKKESIKSIPEEVELKASALIEKVNNSIRTFERTIWERNEVCQKYLKSHSFKNFKSNGVCLFTDAELKALDTIGDFEYWFTVAEEDDIYKLQKMLENTMRMNRVKRIISKKEDAIKKLVDSKKVKWWAQQHFQNQK